MTKFILAQIFLLLGAMIMVYSGLPKHKKQIMMFQDIQLAFMTIGLALLGSVSGAVNNIIGIARNKLHSKGWMTTRVSIVFILATVVVSLPINNLGWVGLLPIISTCAFTAVINCKSIVTYKCIFIMTCVLWLIHDIYIHAWVALPFDIFGIITNSIAIFQKLKEARSNE